MAVSGRVGGSIIATEISGPLWIRLLCNELRKPVPLPPVVGIVDLSALKAERVFGASLGVMRSLIDSSDHQMTPRLPMVLVHPAKRLDHG